MPAVFEFERDLMPFEVPSVIVVGDRDAACLRRGPFMKRPTPMRGLPSRQ